MAGEPEAGTVNTEQALMLLLLDKPSDLRALEKDGAFKQIARDRYWLKDLVQGYVRHARAHAQDTDTTTLAMVFGMQQTRVSQISHDGWYKQLEGTRGKYNWVEACRGYIKYLKDADRRSSKSSSESRIRDAKARDIEVRTQQRLARLVPLTAYEEMIDGIAGMVRSEFAGLAAASTRDLTMRRIIEREVNARLRRIAEYAMAQAIRLETAGGADNAIRTDGAGPVGSSQQDVSADSGGAGTA